MVRCVICIQEMSSNHCIFDPTTIDILGLGGTFWIRFFLQILHDIVESIAIFFFFFARAIGMEQP